ncbi:RAMP superfamily CRISPR-associated protein [Klebsiella quasipneumoniae]|uniref:RAMP superfamily CRISPR-associated protein n=1 Tax=Klebsiella quasipneumoniae TaxID=1463165 RepID=UPI002ABC63A8|nr:RAMP superfamily CRISPR-associated protein [Klebsiella quasipneumoniae]MDZ0185194.1 RAMP superfamily CRISPR-associated protein [Klebsiella quasipneumoniae]
MRTLNFTGSISTLEPLTVTLKNAVTTSGHRLPRNGGFNATPYFPGTSIRGTLRHAAHKVVVERVGLDVDGKSPFDLAGHFMLAQGVDINGEAETFTAGDINAGAELRSKNPLISLFGRWGLSGKVGVGNAIPVGDNQWGMFGGGARAIMFERDETLIDFLETEQVERLGRLLEEQAEASVDISHIKSEQDALKKVMKSADKETKSEIQSQLRELDKKIQARKDRKQESRESIRRPIDPYEAFVTGAELSHRMSLKNATDEEAGLFIAALIRFAAEPRFGSHANHNCGLVEAQWTVTTWKPGELVPITLGEIDITTYGVQITGDELTAMVKAFNDNQSFDFTAR